MTCQPETTGTKVTKLDAFNMTRAGRKILLCVKSFITSFVAD